MVPESELQEQREPMGDRRWWLRSVVRVSLVTIAGLIFIVMLGVFQRWGWISGGGGVAAGGPNAEYTCPMHPQIRQDKPGRCPICGMELVVASAAGGNNDEYAVNISPAQRRLANIQTVEAKLVSLNRRIRTIGKLAFDESRQATIAAYVDGRIERMFADYTGVKVAKGDHLVVLYSPELYAAQAEFVESKRSLQKMTKEAIPEVLESQKQLVVDSRYKLVELGMTKEQIAEVEKTLKAQSRMTVYAPIGGTVIKKTVVDGQYVKVGQTIYQIADLSMVWLMLELFPEDASQVRFGQEVRAVTQSLPGQEFIGRVAFIDPVVSEKTRTVKVRVEMLNLDGRLRPGDYATATITVPTGPTGKVYDAALAGKWISPMHPQIIRAEAGNCPICGMKLVPTSKYGYSDVPIPQTKSLVVPRDAVLKVGKHSVVYVESEVGKFEIYPITVGSFTDQYATVLSGLEAGDKVAVSGNFLIDSEMQLSSKPSLIDPTRALVKKGPLRLKHIHIEAIAGEPGKSLEAMYAAYLDIQATLAADKKVPEAQAQALQKSASEFLQSKGISTKAESQAKVVLANAAKLHQEIKEARKAFKPISHSVIRLAAQLRGADAKQPLIHFYCSMVPGGGGDWLQHADPPANPYWGHKMLRCAEKIEVLPTKGHQGNAKQ